MQNKLKVLVLFDITYPPPKDQDFLGELKTQTRNTELSVFKALNENGHEVRLLGVFNDPGTIIDEIKHHPPDIVFNMTEQFNNQSAHERDVAGLLEMLNVRYTGTGPTGLTLCKNKAMTKEILSYHRIHFPDFAIFRPGAVIRRPKKLDFPLFVKPLKDEASYGISQESFVENDQAFEERIRFIHERMDQDALAEEYIEGRELYVSILGSRRLEVLPIREVIFSKVPEDQPRFSTFKAKWDRAYRKRWGIQNTFAGNLPEGVAERIAKICKKVYRVLHISGYARIDLRLTDDGKIFVLEANPNPDLSFNDEFSRSAQRHGLEYKDIINRIIKLAFMD